MPRGSFLGSSGRAREIVIRAFPQNHIGLVDPYASNCPRRKDGMGYVQIDCDDYTGYCRD
jgi:hypothetical protein